MPSPSPAEPPTAPSSSTPTSYLKAATPPLPLALTTAAPTTPARNFRGGVDSDLPPRLRGLRHRLHLPLAPLDRLSCLSKTSHYNFDPDTSSSKNCTLAGVPNYELGRHHHDALFFLVDCTFYQHHERPPHLPQPLPPRRRPTHTARTFKTTSSTAHQHLGRTQLLLQLPPRRPNWRKSRRRPPPWFKDNLTTYSPRSQTRRHHPRLDPSPTPPTSGTPKNKTAPTIKSLTINGTQITITFSENVTAKGKPVLLLADGSKATYAAGSGTTAMLFNTPAEPATVRSLALNSLVTSSPPLGFRGTPRCGFRSCFKKQQRSCLLYDYHPTSSIPGTISLLPSTRLAPANGRHSPNRELVMLQKSVKSVDKSRPHPPKASASICVHPRPIPVAPPQ